jgi:nitrous oxide reductase accessory protein NosL
MHCLEEHLGQGITLKNPKVVDVTTLKFISIADAFYVVGSSKRGTMSRVSKYAFLNLEDAKKFQTLYGGEIMDFNGAHEKAKEEFR